MLVGTIAGFGTAKTAGTKKTETVSMHFSLPEFDHRPPYPDRILRDLSGCIRPHACPIRTGPDDEH